MNQESSLKISKKVLSAQYKKKQFYTNMYVDFRILGFMTHAVKIQVKIVCKRMENKNEEQLGCDQYSFRKNKGKREAISSVRLLIEKKLELDKDTLSAFVNL